MGHSIPYVYEFGNLLIGKENIYMYGADYDDDPTSKKVRSLNYGRNKRNYKDAYSDGSVIETNFDDIMKFLRDEYNTELGNKSDNSITTYEFNRYWSSKLNFSNQPFVIGVRPFQGCKNLRQVDIQLKNIAAGGKFSTFDYYFQDLKKLEIVYFTENINATGTKTFSGCESLKQVTMPGLERISDGSFHNCKNLRIYTLEPRLNYIHPTAFIGCSALNNLIIKTNSSNLQNIFINKIIFSKKNNNNNIHTIETQRFFCW